MTIEDVGGGRVVAVVVWVVGAAVVAVVACVVGAAVVAVVAWVVEAAVVAVVGWVVGALEVVVGPGRATKIVTVLLRLTTVPGSGSRRSASWPPASHAG